METKLFVATKAFIQHKGRVLILRESAKDLERAHIGKYDVPGGRIKPGESLDSSLISEVKEETGLDIEIGKVLFVNESWPKVKEEQYQIIRIFFVCKSNSDQAVLSDEHDSCLWIDPKLYKNYPIIENLFPAFDSDLENASNFKKIPDIWFTMGPSSSDLDIIQKLLEEGANGIRLTFSYGTPELQIERAKTLKNISRKIGKKCMVIADLEGEKIRLGDFGEATHLDVKSGEQIIISEAFDKEKMQIPIRKNHFIDKASTGDKIMVGDGSVSLETVKKAGNRLICNVLNGGRINPNRGIIIQTSNFQPSCLTEKDRGDLEKAAGHPELFDAIALSFVSDAGDIIEAKKLLGKNKMPIIAKIETRKGLENLGNIANEANMIMIARGDLALFFPWAELGNIVEKIVKTCQKYNKPWILATQVVEGLERFAFPTRAEICDLHRWIKEGMSTVMLSYETAFGSRPVDAIRCVKQIIEASKPTS